ncbi:cc-nbs-lrr resistance protein [Corchorus olitorius]|uniref:Cc-nbs-lrr resistance protein n=1 Tax=Corchorus olitorius TaxID=93759 RepID=A0A1R3JQ32_9ROSI|nr:cc-nbs-lrr resistance protein [Corchorus olitorius]
MADALLSAIASTVLDNISSLLRQELSGGLKTELEMMHNTLTTIQAVVRDAEEKQWTSEPIKIWLLQLKNTAYDLEDILDDFESAPDSHRGSLEQISI